MTTRMMAARVSETDYVAARRVLEQDGMSVSQAVQRLMALIARTGQVPSCLAEDDGKNERRREFDDLMGRVAARPRVPWPEGVTDDELLGDERMRRYG